MNGLEPVVGHIPTLRARPPPPPSAPGGNHVLMTGRIDYSKIDKDIRALCRSLNRVGAKTISSCSGHDNGEEAYVSFSCSQRTLLEVISRIDGREELTSGLHNGFNVNIGDGTKWFMKISCETSAFEGKLRHTLRFSCPSVTVIHSILQVVAKKVGRRRR